MASTELLELVKKNLIIEHTEDDSLIQTFINAAVGYAEGFQHKTDGWYSENGMSENTKEAVVIIASYLYESRDGSEGGFCRSQSSESTWNTANLLLRFDREWKI